MVKKSELERFLRGEMMEAKETETALAEPPAVILR
jgi:hypothetical protein